AVHSNLAGETSADRELELVRPTFTATAVAPVNVLTSLAARSPSTRLVTAGSLEEPPEPGATATSPYALSKATAAAYGLLFHELYGTRVVQLRIFMAYGPGQAAVGKLVPYVTLALLRGEPAVLTSGVRRVDWIYVEDVAAAFLAAGLAGEEADGQRVDVGSGTLVSVREVAEEVPWLVGSGELRLGERADRPRDVARAADPALGDRVVGVHEEVRRAEVAVVLRHLVLEDQVVSERVPRQLAQEAVVLVQVVPVVGEDHVRLDLALELLEGAFDVAAVVGEERVGKAAEAHLDRRVGEQRPGAPLGLPGAPVVGAADDDPADLEPAVEPLQ